MRLLQQVGCWAGLVSLVLGGAACVTETDSGSSSGGSGAAASGGNAGSGAGGGGSTTGGSGASGGSGGSGGSSGVGTPGCAPTVDCAKGCSDLPCIDACVARATDTGQTLFNSVLQCGTDAGCDDIFCTMDACPQEWDACQNDFGVNGYICFSTGSYYVCDYNGNCPIKVVDGGAWGPTEAEAAVAGLADCTDHMAAMVVIEGSTAAESGVTSSCVVTTCGPQ